MVVEGDERPEGRMSRDYVGGGDNVVEAVPVMMIRVVNVREWMG